MPAYVLLRLARLCDGIVTIPVLFDGRVGIIERLVIVVGALADPPELEALSSFCRNEGLSALLKGAVLP